MLGVDNVMGFNQREAKLAQRVREMEDQNQILRHQLRCRFFENSSSDAPNWRPQIFLYRPCLLSVACLSSQTCRISG